MKIKKLEFLAFIMILLIVSMPICFSAQMNLIYDANGNLVTGDGVYRVYNSMNRLVKIYNGTNTSGVLLEENIHDTDGEKIILRKIYNSTGVVIERRFYPSENSIYVKNLTAQVNITRVYHNGQLIAENTNGVINYVHSDNKGNVVAVTNSTGQMIENTSYGPYGDITSGGTKSKLSYEAKEYSSVLKSYDFNFRRYNPNSQLFEQPDTIIQNAYRPQNLNHYMFENGNPLKNTDSSGHCVEDACVVEGTVSAGIIVYVVIVSVATTVTAWGISSAIKGISPDDMEEMKKAYELTLQSASTQNDVKSLYDIGDKIKKGDFKGALRDSITFGIDKSVSTLLGGAGVKDSNIDLMEATQQEGTLGKLIVDSVYGKSNTYHVKSGNNDYVVISSRKGYFINGKEVSKETYDKKLNAAKAKSK